MFQVQQTRLLLLLQLLLLCQHWPSSMQQQALG
jgi:hypothetical protein